MLSQYRLVEQIGEGGMGVVWRAVDTTLDREVAIKILPEAFAADPERLARFEREGRLLASLNHPNIATIHGLQEDDGTRFLTMEWVPGEDLAERIARGPIPLDEALAITRSVADALQAAHNGGVIHRDLKPANIRITTAGEVKVLDFGLAKARESGPDPGTTDPAHVATITSAGTTPGAILGTASYMSPEQARGRPTGRRTDLWALGCVLYEMLTGRKAFEGETASDTLAAILRSEPDWTALRPRTPPSIRRLLRRCLQKDPERRLHSAADARIEIDEAGSEPAEELPHGILYPPRRLARRWLPWSIVSFLAIAAVGVAAIVGKLLSPPTPPPLHLAVTLPHNLDLRAAMAGELLAAVSPDGTRVAFTARDEDTVRLHLRSLDAPGVVAVPETEGASSPFFSPDGQWVAFFSEGKLKKVSVQGGSPVDLCDAPSGRGGSWASDGTIIASLSYTSGLSRIPAEGGMPEAVTAVDGSRNERTHRWPDVLPGGRAVLFTIGTLEQPGYYEDATIAVGDLSTGEVRPLIEGGSIARYASTGHLIYSREGSLLAVPFDVGELRVTGPPATLMAGVDREATSGAVHFGVSRDGKLMYLPAGPESSEVSMVWVDREGRIETILETPKPYLTPRLSPDGTKVLVGVGPGLGDGDVWIHDLVSGSSTRLTFESDYVSPIWTPDGRRVVYGVTRGGSVGVAWKAADGSDAEQMLFGERSEFVARPESWSPGGKTIIYNRGGGWGGLDLMTAAPGDEEPRPLLAGPESEGGITFSPDGHWMAYSSDESGQMEVYVQPYPGPGGKWQLSTDGGKGPIWSEDGREIFYTDGRKLIAIPVSTTPSFTPGRPEVLFDFPFLRDVGPWPDYDVSPDGKRFLMFRRSADDPPHRRIRIVTSIGTLLDD
jgi:serine/threonine-protein kinase